LAKAVSVQQATNLSFGQTAISMGLLTQEQVSRISHAQRTLDMLYGELAVKMGFLMNSQVAQVLAEQKRKHIYIGEALVQIGAISQHVLGSLLTEYEKEHAPFKMTGLELPDNIPLPHLSLVICDTSKKMLSRLVNLVIKPGPCELVKKIDGNNLAVVVDFAGGVSVRYAITFPEVVRKNVALANLNAHTPFDEVFSPQKDLAGPIINFVSILCNNVVSKAAKIGFSLMPAKCSVRENGDYISVHGDAVALLFPFYLASGEWIDVAILLDER
jgi:hypothetical protein